MAEEIHPVIELLAARMATYPEEFEIGADGAIYGRWKLWIDRLGWHMNEAEKKLIYGKTREKMFNDIHEGVMDELLNGPQRRVEAEKAREAEMQRLLAQTQKLSAAAGVQGSQLYPQNLSQAMAAQQQALNANIAAQLRAANAMPGLKVTQDFAEDCIRLSSGKTQTKIPMETVQEHGVLNAIKKVLGL